jgi:predicted RNase H-like HicB family nuclease
MSQAKKPAAKKKPAKKKPAKKKPAKAALPPGWEEWERLDSYRITYVLLPDLEEGGYTAIAVNLPGCCSEGDSIDEAKANLQKAAEGLIESCKAHGVKIPLKEDDGSKHPTLARYACCVPAVKAEQAKLPQGRSYLTNVRMDAETSAIKGLLPHPLQDLVDGLLARLDAGIQVSGTIVSLPFAFVIQSKAK